MSACPYAVERQAAVAEPLMAFRGISLEFNERKILGGFDLEIGRDEFICAVATPISGKTTKLRLLAGMRRPTDGEIIYVGSSVAGRSQDVAVVFQDLGKLCNRTRQ
jgi:NitT/TauT family transport system ATP-binding protein